MSYRTYHSRPCMRNQRGVTLLEIMISLLVASLGILGVASLQYAGMKSAQEGYFFSAAALLADDIAERIRVNSTAKNAYAQAMASSYTAGRNCETSQCSASQMAAYDVQQWLAAVAARLPNSAGAVAYTAGSPAQYAITVRWRGLSDGNCDSSGGSGTEYWCFKLSLEAL